MFRQQFDRERIVDIVIGKSIITKKLCKVFHIEITLGRFGVTYKIEYRMYSILVCSFRFDAHIRSQDFNDLLNAVHTSTTTTMSSNLLVLNPMEFEHEFQDPLHKSLDIVETQYLSFNMSQYGSDGGVFSSPNFPHNYPQDAIIFYQFVASTNYRVVIEIDFFEIRGVSPQCTHDYLDVFINLTDFNLVNDQLLHRFCGRNKPPLLISITNLLLLGFFTEDMQTERGFNGSFRFIPAQRYKENLIREPCDYIFDSSKSKRGEFFSPTYPGTYLPWQFCNYSFVGQSNERVHIRFRDLMLFKTPNAQHCAIDLIRLYDNTLRPIELERFLSSFKQTSPVDGGLLSEQSDSQHITDLCGTYSMPLDVYSTKSSLLFYFITTHYAELTNEEQSQLNEASMPSLWRKGFYAEYEFLSTLTTLDFIPRNQTNQYLSGTECDQTIKSFGKGHGILQSPNWPNFYKPQTSCSTYLLGIDDRYGLENVEIEFEQFDIDCQLAIFVIYNASRIHDYHLQSHPSYSFVNSTLVSKEKSFNNYYQQEVDFKENLTFCGHFKPEGRFVSQNSLLKLSFIPKTRPANNLLPSLVNGGKFQAKYRFIKSYHQLSKNKSQLINTGDCSLFYYQSRALNGKFQPPRSSDEDYFSNANCTFHFQILNSNFRLLISYDYFNIADNDVINCPSDNLTYTYRSHSLYKSYPYIYCGYRNYPPPYLTDHSVEQFRIHFRSNNDSETGLGFDGRYEFVNRTHPLFSSQCRTPFDPIIEIYDKEQSSGNLSSSGYPENVICEWSYRTKVDYQFKLDLTVVDLEGSKTKDPPQGCQSSVLKIFSEERIDELCGQQETISYIITKSNWFTVQFISFTRQTGELLKGFHLTWTIIRPKTTDPDYLDCQPRNETAFSIHRSLICDNYVHCQPYSNADELSTNCSQLLSTNSYLVSFPFLRQHYIFISIIILLIILTITVAILLIFFIIKTKNYLHQEKIRSSTKTYFTDINTHNLDDSTDVNLMKQTVTTV
ncbi:unnamed protein product [Adineta ricciae]|uniref:CUB domain-containing protein n=1 Tax=Adineta ricciae TaxID=249248 RepID=A0A814Y2L4_ADIRI|nr:unnamed protein product [Adineta ricciae]